jgi:hypothetical protein
MGRSAHSRRAFKARDRHRRNKREQIHDPPETTPSQTSRSFLENHAKSLVSVDFLTVPTIRFQILYVFLALAHDRRRILHFAVTAHPTAEWTVQQLQEAFPWDTAPRYLLRDRDRIFGQDFSLQVKAMGSNRCCPRRARRGNVLMWNG